MSLFSRRSGRTSRGQSILAGTILIGALIATTVFVADLVAKPGSVPSFKNINLASWKPEWANTFFSGESVAAPSSVFPLANMILPARSPELLAQLAIAHNNLEEARRILLAAMPTAPEPSLGRMRFLLAKATPDISEARVPLEALVTSDHALSQWARLRLAERLRDRDPNAAADHASILLADPMFRARAEQILALSLLNAGRRDEAEPMLRSLVAEAPEKSAALVYTMPLASILADKPDLDSQKAALALYRRIATRAPQSESGAQARILAQAVLAKMPDPQRIALSTLTADEAFAEAESLSESREYGKAASNYAALAKRFKGDQKIVCDAKLGQAKALFSAKKRDDALILFEDVIRLCSNPELRTVAHFQAGRALLRKGDPRGAIVHYDLLAKEFPKNRLADDALVAAATAFHDLGDADGERARLTQVMALPVAQTDMRPDARFMLAWLERQQHNHAAAIVQLDQQIADGVGESSDELIGRSQYWRARTLLDMGRRDEGEEAMLAVYHARPLSYYGQQALARIDELDHPLALQLPTDMHEEPHSAENPLRLPLREELQNKEFQHAIELLRVAEQDAAYEELDNMGCFKSTTDDDLFLLCAALFSEFGADNKATNIARRRGMKITAALPRGQALASWRVVYPRAYPGMLESAASSGEVPAAFVRAVAREESSFDPNAVSPANAYGLIQLIRPTARKYAGPLSLPSDPDSLKKPDINLRIGTGFMHALFERYKQNVAVVPAAYNAGPGAADKWLRERGGLSFDEWVETIPYTETRRYTRRVLQSYAVYAWLDEGRMPPLPKALGAAADAKVADNDDDKTPDRPPTSDGKEPGVLERAASGLRDTMRTVASPRGRGPASRSADTDPSEASDRSTAEERTGTGRYADRERESTRWGPAESYTGRQRDGDSDRVNDGEPAPARKPAPAPARTQASERAANKASDDWIPPWNDK